MASVAFKYICSSNSSDDLFLLLCLILLLCSSHFSYYPLHIVPHLDLLSADGAAVEHLLGGGRLGRRHEGDEGVPIAGQRYNLNILFYDNLCTECTVCFTMSAGCFWQKVHIEPQTGFAFFLWQVGYKIYMRSGG